METEDKTKNIGLRGIKVADTKVSHIDGQKGVLIYRGYRIEDLAENSTFEETAYLLLKDSLPTSDELNDFNARLSDNSRLPDFLESSMKTWPKETNPPSTVRHLITPETTAG